MTIGCRWALAETMQVRIDSYFANCVNFAIEKLLQFQRADKV
jgi:hypothetical protein